MTCKVSSIIDANITEPVLSQTSIIDKDPFDLTSVPDVIPMNITSSNDAIIKKNKKKLKKIKQSSNGIIYIIEEHLTVSILTDMLIDLIELSSKATNLMVINKSIQNSDIITVITLPSQETQEIKASTAEIITAEKVSKKKND
ncbi:hypothetical protein C1645_824075 [Glomus cerebriforme]|uniref:Uncharacterized protein n=1 Tax=Glomus cerebriforme TaxID=658196 RepID=A0A397SZ71_9GLOM|nr:hypothetical protein C1645_824075 [Glomus cerebriforme]